MSKGAKNEAYCGVKHVRDIAADALPEFSRDIISAVCDFDHEVRFMWSLGEKEEINFNWNRIHAVTLNPKTGHIFAWSIMAIEIYTLEGKYIKTFQPDIEDSHIFKPRALVFATNGELFIIDNHDDFVYVFQEDGKLVRKWDVHVSDAVHFRRPSAIALDGKGHIYLACDHNHSVGKFTTDGVYMSTFFHRRVPLDLTGMAVCSNGMILIHNSDSSKVDQYLDHFTMDEHTRPPIVLPTHHQYATTATSDLGGAMIFAERKKNSLLFTHPARAPMYLEHAGGHTFSTLWGVSYCPVRKILLVMNKDERIDVFSY